MRPFLTIAIPTYNRNVILNETVSRILAQVDSDCEVVIIDNASRVPVSESLPQVQIEQVKIIRNRGNIGGNANIIRCLEQANGVWLWIVGDDDFIQPGSVSIVKRLSQEHAGATFLNFTSTTHTRPSSSVTKGVRHLLKELDDFSNLLFVSTGVYNVDRVSPALKYGYHFAYSCAAHVAAMLMSVGDEGEVHWRTECIIERPPSDEQSIHNLATIYQGLPTLTELPLDEDLRDALFESISENLPSAAGLLAFAVIHAMTLGDRAYARYLFPHLARRLRPYKCALGNELYILAGSTALRWPAWSATMLSGVARLLGRKLAFHHLTRSYERL